MSLDQSEFDVRCEWGKRASLILSAISDVVIVVDVLSFTTAVEVATNRGGIVYPYRWHDESAYEFAESVEAEVADRRNRNGYCLSPTSLQNIPRGTRLVLPSPNGSEISLATGNKATLAGSLRNCGAVARAAISLGAKIAVIPAGERWDDGSLRPCFEDWVGAGAIISFLPPSFSFSPEANAAAASFKQVAANILGPLSECSSGKEKISRGEEPDLVLAASLNVSDCVPVLGGGYFARRI
jgi:2-phosphosulfolactate phosphatase